MSREALHSNFENFMKILNLYSGIGGNRKLWLNVDVTAVEIEPEIAKIYQDFFPNDKVIVNDAHEYLRKHYNEYDFIWSSPPCPTHSRIKLSAGVFGHGYEYEYPDMNLYQEIILLKHLAKANWVVENVQPYYQYLLEPSQRLGRHAYWSNFDILYRKFSNNGGIDGYTKIESRHIYFNLDEYKLKAKNKMKLLRNCVDPEIGLHILDCARGTIPPMQEGLFAENISKNSA